MKQSRNAVTLLLASCSLWGGAGAALATISVSTVPVGNPGNANDSTGYGSVGYAYNIGQVDVTAGQYAAFLNAVAATDPLGLYNSSMATDTTLGAAFP